MQLPLAVAPKYGPSDPRARVCGTHYYPCYRALHVREDEVW